MSDFLRDNWKNIIAFLFIAFVLWRGFAGCVSILSSRAELSPSEHTATIIANNPTPSLRATPLAAQRAATRSAQRITIPIPTSTPHPTVTPRPKYTPTPDWSKYGSSRNQPMPIGKPMEFTDGTTIIVESVTENANQIIKRHDAWTEPPPNGHQFLLVNVKVVNNGNEPIDIYTVSQLSLVGKSNVSYDTWNDCWTFPNEFDTSRTLFPAGSLTGNICFTVKSSDVDSLVMFLEIQSLLGGNEFVYWALK